MNLFARDTDNTKKTTAQLPIPQDILDAVRVMNVSSSSEMADRSSRQAPVVVAQGTSPFLEKGVSLEDADISTIKDLPVSPAGASAGISTILFKKRPGQKVSLFFGALANLKGKMSRVIAGGTLLLLVLLSVVVWFFFFRDNKEIVVATPVSNESESDSTASSVAISVVELPYAIDAPNYLFIDTETITQESFGELIAETGKRIVTARIAKPVEFLLTDKNNNPIAFSRFAYLMKLELPEELLASLGESFSVFLFNDGGNIRLGLSLALTDQAKGANLIAQKEKSLPFFFRTILFSGNTIPQGLVFRSGVYNIETVRFVNIDNIQHISFDFVLRPNEWLIGTSRDTLRAILDKKQKKAL